VRSACRVSAVARLGSAVACVASFLAIAGCAPESVSLVLPPAPPLAGSAGACSARPSTLAHLAGIVPNVMAIDELNLYVVASSGADGVVASSGADGSATQSLWRIPKDGSPPKRLVTSETPIADFRLDDGYPQAGAVFWTTVGTSDADGGAMGSVQTTGLGAADKPVILASNRRAPGALMVLDTRVYWAEQEVDLSGQLVEAIVETSTTGGPVTRVQTLDADQVPHRFAAYDFGRSPTQDASVGLLVWTTWNGQVGSESIAEVVECPLPAPFGPQTVITGADAGGAGGVNLDSRVTGVLYSRPQGIAEVDVGLDGGQGSPRPIAATAGFVDRIEDDDTDVYFVERPTGRLIDAPRFHLDAQAPRTIASSVDPATAFRVDDACVYWIDARAETITMATK
jgi:hypothetical protein